MFGSFSVLFVSLSFLVLAVNPSAAEGFTRLRKAGRILKRSPVILVPGDLGNRLEAKLNKPSSSYKVCTLKTPNYINLWLNPLEIAFDLKCWVENMRLVYDNQTRKTSNMPGVDVRVPGFGGTETVEIIDPNLILSPRLTHFLSFKYYFKDIVDSLVGAGYVRNVSVRGAPYDFRKAPNEMQDYYKKLKNLIEETFLKNNKTKVTIVCHSMGCAITSYFLNTKDQAWKDKHIKGLITLGPALGGAVKALKTIAAGENLGYKVDAGQLKLQQRSTVSLSYLVPSRHLWSPNEVIAFTKHKNYTVKNYDEFFKDIGFSTAFEMYKDTFRYAEIGLNPPGVEVFCIYGVGLNTTIRLNYTQPKSFPDKPVLEFGEGDGTVNLRSLQVCSNWRGRQKQKVFLKTLPKVEHLDMLRDEYVKKFIVDYVTS
ncbi:phospholipase A2 group XV [Trichonephila inaurata madagascariensis]|uniref:Phospholipase A2 group XV n=1 Tax=Trichonephila inaurata madagascariensis TaxID=2747483 RepID=A0A8X6XV57_9ARAC|nr:phospholipase A2 group XV [Trichonephila inaurata madagascariensis]